MTPTSPTWGDVEEFLAADGWRRLAGDERGGKRQTQIFFEKVLEDGRALQTHISHDRSSRVSPGRFGAILRGQLEVSREEFWTAIRTGEPVQRPVPLDEEEFVEHDAWVIQVLVGELHMGVEVIAELSEEEAQARVYEYWSRPGR